MSVAAATRSRGVHPPGLGPFTLGGRLGPGFLGLVIGAVLWEMLARVWDQPFFPPFSAVLMRLFELVGSGLIIGNLINSLFNLFIGFTLSAVLGVTIGVLMGAYTKVEMALDVYVYAMLTAPSLVFAPVFFAIFGANDPRPSVIGVIVLYTIFIVIVNTVAGIRNVNKPLIEMGRSYLASDRQLFFKIILPAATPLIFAGLRLGMGRAVKGMINGEMFIAIVGLGAVVTSAGKRFDAEGVLAVLLLIIVVALICVKIVQIIDVRLTSWLPATSKKRRRA
ncbi:MAG TPA: ABC transporter permease [Candidatus Saccharimonadales bacterium]|nr:ABC transporter permease [Candidatus Saccharimonadales bacterium]